MIFLDMNLIQVCGSDYKLRPSLFGASVCLVASNTRQVELESRLFHGTLTAPEALFCHAQCHMVEISLLDRISFHCFVIPYFLDLAGRSQSPQFNCVAFRCQPRECMVCRAIEWRRCKQPVHN